MTTETAVEPAVEPAMERYLLSALVRQAAVLEDLKRHIEAAGGRILKSEDLGVRALAYPINKARELNLISAFFQAEPAAARELDKQLQEESGLERYLLTKWSVETLDEPRARRRQPQPEEVTA
jgi:ribosomal protein S6